jgi:hypothetical protein
VAAADDERQLRRRGAGALPEERIAAELAARRAPAPRDGARP